MPSMWCKKCHCTDDGYGAENGVCRKCIRNMKSAHSGKTENVCVECGAIIPSNWDRCPHCSGAKKY